MSQAWKEVAQGHSVECEARDPILRRYLNVHVRPISVQAPREWKEAGSFAVGSVHDITERKRAEEALQQRNSELEVLNRMSYLFQACQNEKETYDVIVSVCKKLFPSDSGGLYMFDHSQALFKLAVSWGRPPTGKQAFDRNECLSLQYCKVHMGEKRHPERLCSHLDAFPKQGYLCALISTSTNVLGVLHLSFGQEDPGYAGDEHKRMNQAKETVVNQVTELYALFLVNLRLRDPLKMEAIRDPLTGLYNRRYMEDSLEREVQRAKRHRTPVGIILADIDHFKSFNDTYGHMAGDVVLRELGVLFRVTVHGMRLKRIHYRKIPVE